MGEQVGARFYGDIAQLGEHLPCKQGVRGSNPLISTELQKSNSKGNKVKEIIVTLF